MIDTSSVYPQTNVHWICTARGHMVNSAKLQVLVKVEIVILAAMYVHAYNHDVFMYVANARDPWSTVMNQ